MIIRRHLGKYLKSQLTAILISIMEMEFSAWIVDFSDAQYNGIASNLENMPDFVIRGCSFHFQRNAEKNIAKSLCRRQC
jgi:hypothetical protein